MYHPCPFSVAPSTTLNVSGWFAGSAGGQGSGSLMDDSSIAGADSGNDSVDITIGWLNSSDSRISIDDSVNNSPDTFTGGLNSSDSMISLDVSGNDSTVGLTTLADGSASTAVLSATGHSGKENGQNQTKSELARTAERYSC